MGESGFQGQTSDVVDPACCLGETFHNGTGFIGLTQPQMGPGRDQR